MHAKPQVTCVWVAGLLVVGWLAGGCADVDDDYARDAAIVPIAAGSVLVEGAVQSKVDDSDLQYEQTHPVNSFDDFEESFHPSSDAPWSDPFNSGVRGH